MEATPKHASGKTDFQLAEAAIDVAVNEADCHDDEDCPQDDTCECPTAETVNDGHNALVRMDRELASLREQVRTLTAERDGYAGAAERSEKAAEALRARVAELEEAYAALERTLNNEIDRALALRKAHGARDNETFAGFVARLASERDAAQQRAKALAEELAKVLGALAAAQSALPWGSEIRHSTGSAYDIGKAVLGANTEAP